MKRWMYFAQGLLLLVIDRLSKLVAFNKLQYESIIMSDYLSFDMHWNRGISFSWLHFNSPLGFSILTLFIIGVIGLFLWYTHSELIAKKSIFFEVMVLAGALSNLIDRFTYGAVLDFIDVHLNNWHFPIFNFADIFICLGVLGIIFFKKRGLFDEVIAESSSK